MAVIEGGISGALVGVGAEAASPLHTARYPISVGAGGAYKLGANSGTIGASIVANSEIFQFRYMTVQSRIALVYKISISAGANVAASAAALIAFRLTAARAWTSIGTGGTRLDLTGNNCKLRTSLATSEVNDAGISTTGALTVGTKTLDTTDLSAIAQGIGTGAITTAVALPIIPKYSLLDADGEGQYPLVLENEEGFIIRTGATNFPAGMTWHFGVEVLWLEVPVF